MWCGCVIEWEATMSRGRHIASRTRSGRVSWGVLGLVLGLFLAMAMPAFAGGSADKATGSGDWINGQGLDFYAEFNAHEGKDGRPAKGSLYQNLDDGTGGFTVEVDAVMVFDGYACFGGNTDSAWGTYASHLNEYRWTTVVDGGSGLTETGDDYLRGGWVGTSAPSWCLNGDTASNNAWYGGNVQIHYGGSEA